MEGGYFLLSLSGRGRKTRDPGGLEGEGLGKEIG